LAGMKALTLDPTGVKDKVFALQTMLNKKGFNTGTPDGKFGNGTLVALKAFQQQHGLTADGSAGPITWGKLFDIVPVA